MRLPHAVAFPLEWTDSVANAPAHLEGPELVLTCHVPQGKAGSKKSKRKVTSTDKLCSMKTGLLYAFNSTDRVKSNLGKHKWELIFFFSLYFTHSMVFLHCLMHVLNLFLSHFSGLCIPVLLLLLWPIFFSCLHPPLPVFCLMHLLSLLLSLFYLSLLDNTFLFSCCCVP